MNTEELKAWYARCAEIAQSREAKQIADDYDFEIVTNDNQPEIGTGYTLHRKETGTNTTFQDIVSGMDANGWTLRESMLRRIRGIVELDNAIGL